jgi:putative NADPH-quinone reductase
MTTLLLLAHPDFAASRANRALLAGLNDLPGLEVAELYALYPNGQIDFMVERERMLRTDRLVLQFPLYWYSTPPLLKHWEDAVLTPLFYLEPDIAASMAGLPVLAATTTGGVSESYQPGGATGMTIDELFAPLIPAALSGDRYQSHILHVAAPPTPRAYRSTRRAAGIRATARKCGWLWQAPFALHDVRNLNDAALARAGEDYRSVILSAPMLEQRLEVAA